MDLLSQKYIEKFSIIYTHDDAFSTTIIMSACETSQLDPVGMLEKIVRRRYSGKFWTATFLPHGDLHRIDSFIPVKG